MIRIFIAHKQKLMRSCFSRALSSESDFEVVGQASSAEAAATLSRTLEPDILLVDINSTEMGATEAAKRIIRSCANVKLIFISSHIQLPLIKQLIDMGLQGFVTNDESIDDIFEAIRVVSNNKRYLSPGLAEQLALSFISNSDTPFDCLTARELNIALMFANGKKPIHVAETLSLSVSTVNTYRSRIFEKLDIKSDVTLVHLALFHKLIAVNQSLCA